MNNLKLKEQFYKGKLIVFEGTDGAGKTTLVSMTRQLLESYGKDVISIKQPTDLSRKTKLFQKMMYSENHGDIDYRAVQLLTMSDRIQHNHEVIEPALEAGKIVLCDRYIYTSLAGMLARGYDNEKWFFNVAQHIIKPNKIFLAYVPADYAINRIKQRPAEADRYLDEELLRNVARQFMDMSTRENFYVLDSTQTPDVTFRLVYKELREMDIL